LSVKNVVAKNYAVSFTFKLNWIKNTLSTLTVVDFIASFFPTPKVPNHQFGIIGIQNKVLLIGCKEFMEKTLALPIAFSLG
jgi:hypothetical protein